jgi:hypothetical protein
MAQKAPKRLKRGRPRKNDQVVIDLAAAIMENFTVGPQQARDVALAWLEGEQAPPTRLPRGAKGKPGDLVGHRLPSTFEARSRTVREKRLRPRPVVVSAFSQVLRALTSKDADAIREALASLKRL